MDSRLLTNFTSRQDFSSRVEKMVISPKLIRTTAVAVNGGVDANVGGVEGL